MRLLQTQSAPHFVVKLDFQYSHGRGREISFHPEAFRASARCLRSLKITCSDFACHYYPLEQLFHLRELVLAGDCEEDLELSER